MPHYFIVSKVPVKKEDAAKFNRDFFVDHLEPKFTYTADTQTPANVICIDEENEQKALAEAKKQAKHLQGKNNDAFRFVIFKGKFTEPFKGEDYFLDLKEEDGATKDTIKAFKVQANNLELVEAIVPDMPVVKKGFIYNSAATEDVKITFGMPIAISLPKPDIKLSGESEEAVPPSEVASDTPLAENAAAEADVENPAMKAAAPQVAAENASAANPAPAKQSFAQAAKQQLSALVPSTDAIKKLLPFATIGTGAALAAKLGYIGKGISYLAALKGQTLAASSIGFAATWGTASTLFALSAVVWLAIEANMQSTPKPVAQPAPVKPTASKTATPGAETPAAEVTAEEQANLSPAEQYAAALTAARARRDSLQEELGYKKDSHMARFLELLEQGKTQAYTSEGTEVANIRDTKQDVLHEVDRQFKHLKRISANQHMKEELEQAMQARTRVSPRPKA